MRVSQAVIHSPVVGQTAPSSWPSRSTNIRTALSHFSSVGFQAVPHAFRRVEPKLCTHCTVFTEAKAASFELEQAGFVSKGGWSRWENPSATEARSEVFFFTRFEASVAERDAGAKFSASLFT